MEKLSRMKHSKVTIYSMKPSVATDMYKQLPEESWSML